MEKLTMTLRLLLNDREYHVTIVRRRPHLVLRIDGQDHEITEVPSYGEGHGRIVMGGHRMEFVRAGVGDRLTLRLEGRTFEVERVDPFSEIAGGTGAQDVIRAPMPGAVVSVHRQAGESVARGEAIVTIESMKLQMALAAQRDGVVAQVLRGEGETFEKDEALVQLEPQNEGA